MDTPESIAEWLVTVIEDHGGRLRNLCVGSEEVGWAMLPDQADTELARVRAAVADACRRAVWAATAVGVPGLLSPERLSGIECRYITHDTRHEDIPALLAHVRTLERLLGDSDFRSAARDAAKDALRSARDRVMNDPGLCNNCAIMAADRVLSVRQP